MRKLIVINLFWLLCLSSYAIEANPFSSLYESGKDYITNMNDVDFWKGACCVVVGLFALDKGIPLVTSAAKSTWRFIFRMPKEKTEVEKVSDELKADFANKIETLKGELQQQQRPSNPIPNAESLEKEESLEKIQKLFDAWKAEKDIQSANISGASENLWKDKIQEHHDDIIGIYKAIENFNKICSALRGKVALQEKRIETVLLHFGGDKYAVSTSSSSESDEEYEEKRPIVGHSSRTYNIPPLELEGRALDFADYHRQVTDKKSPNRGYFSPDTNTDASDESSSSEDDSSGTQSSCSTTRICSEDDASFTPGSSIVIHSDSDSERGLTSSNIIHDKGYEIEEFCDDQGNVEMLKRTPRPRKTPKRQGSKLKKSWKPLTSHSARVYTKKTRPQLRKVMSSGSLPTLSQSSDKNSRSNQSTGIRIASIYDKKMLSASESSSEEGNGKDKPASISQSFQMLPILESDTDDEEGGSGSEEIYFFNTEEGEKVELPPTSTTLISQVPHYRDHHEGEGDEVTIPKDKRERIAKARYYQDNKPGKDCNIN